MWASAIFTIPSRGHHGERLESVLLLFLSNQSSDANQAQCAQAKTYWLAAYAMPSQGTAFMFGWKSAQGQQHDICTRTPWAGVAPITTDWRPNYDPSNRGLDLAFKVNTATNPAAPVPMLSGDQRSQVYPTTVRCPADWT
jgi:hypothetical protein